MSRTSLLPVGAVVLLSAIAGPALADESSQSSSTALSAASNAAVVNLRVVVNGQTTAPGAELAVAGIAPPAYNKKTIRATYARTTKILGGLVFTRSATAVQSVATGSTAAATGISATGSAAVGSFHGTLSSSSLGTLMTVTTGKIATDAIFTQTKAGVPSVRGSSKIGTLSISAPALGINETFNGTPKPNQVLYHNSDNSIVIYLNRQIKTTVKDKPAAITVDAVDVQVTNFKFVGNTISGSIVVCPASAR